MKSFRCKTSICLILLTAFIVAATVQVGDAAGGKKKAKKAGHSHRVAGKVMAMDDGSITLQTKTGGQSKFRVTSATTYHLVNKKTTTTTPASQSDLTTGSHVRVASLSGTATQVDIVQKHKHKRK